MQRGGTSEVGFPLASCAGLLVAWRMSGEPLHTPICFADRVNLDPSYLLPRHRGCEALASLGDGAHAHGFARASASRSAATFALRPSSCPRRPLPSSTLSARDASRRCVDPDPRPLRCCVNAPLCHPPASPMLLRARRAFRGVLAASMARSLVARVRPQRLLLHLPLLSPGGDQNGLTECVPDRFSCSFAFPSDRVDRPDTPGTTVAIFRF